MDIIQEKIDNLNAKVKIKIEAKDYSEKYEKSLKSYRKEVQMPGFRQGHVPTSLIKKKYGPSILAQEIDKLLNEALGSHIKDSQLNILGQPLPVMEQEKEIDWTNPGDLEFTYELGIAPDFELALDKIKVNYYKVKVDAELIDKQVDDFARRYGKMGSVDISGDKDMLMAAFAELDENDNLLEGGFGHSSSVAIEYVKDEAAKKKLIGLKVDDVLIIDPKTISRGDADLAAMLNIDKNKAIALTGNVQLKVTGIKRLEPALINEELFTKIYINDEIKTEEEFRTKISSELSNMFAKDSDRLLHRDLSKIILENLKLDLPAAFLKKWIMASNQEVSSEQVNEEFDQYADDLRWQLVTNKIIKDNELKVEFETILNHIKGLIGKQYAQYGMMPPADEELSKYALNVLQNPEESRKITDELYQLKVIEFLKGAIKLNEKEVSFDEFSEIAKG